MKTLALVSLLLFCTALPYAWSVPRNEYPRPDFRRDAWFNLNGTWDFQFDPQNSGEKAGWYVPGKIQFNQKIVVPFPWESKLSGIERPDYKGVAWYRRSFDLPSNWKGKAVYLRFGAVDWKATVWLNGALVGEHEGGYTPFEFRLDAVRPQGNELVVRAEDNTDPSHPVGKQVNWYTHTSGIWQTVWLEARDPEIFLQNFQLYPDAENGQVHIRLSIQNAGRAQKIQVALLSPEENFAPLRQAVQLKQGLTKHSLVFSVANPKLWSPEHPHLYNLDIRLLAEGRLLDCVHTYFGFRKISVQAEKSRPYTAIFLNDKPIYLRGALDQSFTPDGIYTFHTDADIRRDIEEAKHFGLNFLRIHIKIDDPRLYYWADKLGLLIMYDMPSTWRYNAEARRTWELTAHAALERDFNHPSIFAWVLFNETWGLRDSKTRRYTPEIQKWVMQQVDFFKQADPTRLVEDNSPCNYDHVPNTEINSWHFYINDYERAKKHIQKVVDNTYPGSAFNFIQSVQGHQPLMNSEYGGISAGMGDQDISWCFKFLTNELRRHDKIGGYIYTELMDIEWERNGYMNYDRTPKYFGYEAFFPGMTLADLNAPDFVGVDNPPCATKKQASLWRVPVFFSQFSDKPVSDASLRWEFWGWDRFGQARFFQGNSASFSPAAYAVTPLDTLKIRLPNERCLGTLRLWVEDTQGNVLAKNYLNVDVTDGSLSRQEKLSDSRIAVRFSPSDFTQQKWDRFENDPRALGSKIAGLGNGFVTYTIQLPAAVSHRKIEKLELLFEGAARAGSTKVNARFESYPWPRNKPEDYPQTDVTKWPTDVTVILNGVKIKTVHFQDDPADARGVLSHKANFQRGSYGYLTRLNIEGRLLKNVLNRLENRTLTLRFEVLPGAGSPGGFSLYGEKMGRFPVDPTLIFQTAGEGK